MDGSSCHSFDLGGLEDEGHAACGFALDCGDDEGDSGECGEWVRALGAGRVIKQSLGRRYPLGAELKSTDWGVLGGNKGVSLKRNMGEEEGVEGRGG
jgi:hypothetical protein